MDQEQASCPMTPDGLCSRLILLPHATQVLKQTLRVSNMLTFLAEGESECPQVMTSDDA